MLYQTQAGQYAVTAHDKHMPQLARADLWTGLEGDGCPFKYEPFPINARTDVDHRSICRSCDSLADTMIACSHRFTPSRHSASVSAAFMYVLQHHNGTALDEMLDWC